MAGDDCLIELATSSTPELRFLAVQVDKTADRCTWSRGTEYSSINKPITQYNRLPFAPVVLLVEETQRSISGLNGLPGGWMSILVPITLISKY